LALTLRLSEAQYLSAYKGEPLVLLDDILSELDEGRREQVLERVLAYGQSVITSTDLDPFSNEYLSKASILRLCGGELRRADD
jgi:DNA replication and repair protein RecF